MIKITIHTHLRRFNSFCENFSQQDSLVDDRKIKQIVSTLGTQRINKSFLSHLINISTQKYKLNPGSSSGFDQSTLTFLLISN